MDGPYSLKSLRLWEEIHSMHFEPWITWENQRLSSSQNIYEWDSLWDFRASWFGSFLYKILKTCWSNKVWRTWWLTFMHLIEIWWFGMVYLLPNKSNIPNLTLWPNTMSYVFYQTIIPRELLNTTKVFPQRPPGTMYLKSLCNFDSKFHIRGPFRFNVETIWYNTKF